MIKKNKITVAIILGIFVIIAIFYALIWILLVLWNSTIPLIFPGVKKLDFWLSFRLLLLMLIFGSFFGGGHHVTKRAVSKPDPHSKGIHIGWGFSKEEIKK
ncbi:hypothetical protein BBF96_09775 [Anoxybacter fermentans]|uniref:Uncharacterized protein n=1 Tax=Anoxybacter fermentans TaxID=1323375 RepID=A0A3Q9HQX3_9FIRM|nr:hypothetical protein [Anoxybacter fermentans]AZR73648.1 hypothetical protein BBF96_09775 [Anoxybacter fermentans]